MDITTAPPNMYKVDNRFVADKKYVTFNDHGTNMIDRDDLAQFTYHWNENVVIMMKFSWLTALTVVI